MLRQRLRDCEAVEEVTNDVLHVVILAVREGKVRVTDSLPAFTYGVAKNLANNYIRRQAERPVEESFSADIALTVPSDHSDSKKKLDDVRYALAQLDESDHRILLMVLVEGLKPSQIGERLSLSSEVVRTRKSRATKRLIAILGALGQSEK